MQVIDSPRSPFGQGLTRCVQSGASAKFSKPKTSLPNSISFGGGFFQSIGLKNNIVDTVLIKNKPLHKSSGLLSVVANMSKEIHSVDLDKVNISVVSDKRVSVVEAPAFENSLNKFIGIFPEFMGVFKHSQNDRDGLGVHSLKTFKEMIKSDEYKKETPPVQFMLQIGSLFHDLGKIVRIGNKHAKYSEIKAKPLVSRIDEMPKENKQMTLKLIKYHYWPAVIDENPQRMNDFAKTFSLRELELLNMLNKADIKSRKEKEVPQWLNDVNKFYNLQRKVISGGNIPIPKGRSASFIKDDAYRGKLAKNLGVEPNRLQSVVGAHELEHLLKKSFTSKNLSLGEGEINIKNGDYNVNMHIHTVFSDGKFEPLELLETAREYSQKIKKPVYFTTSDHNEVMANREVLKLLANDPKRYEQLRFFTGIEVRTAFTNKEGRRIENEAETLVYGLDPFKTGYKEFLPSQKFPRTHKEIADFYKDEKVFIADPHPKRTISMNLREFVGELFVPNGGQALEAHYSYSESANEPWAKKLGITKDKDQQYTDEVTAIAKEFGLLVTGGRDSHGKSFFHRK